MVGMDKNPPKPGMYRSFEGAELVGEPWFVSEAGLGRFLTTLPEPIPLGSIELNVGTRAVGFVCDAMAVAASKAFSQYGDWHEHLRKPVNEHKQASQSSRQSFLPAILAGFALGGPS